MRQALNGAESIADMRAKHFLLGFDAEHDSRHSVHQFVQASQAFLGKAKWPFASVEHFNRIDGDGYYVRENLVHAGAMIAAAIDRLDQVNEEEGRR